MARSTIQIFSAIAWTADALSRLIGSVTNPTSATGTNTTTGRCSVTTHTVAATGDSGGNDLVCVWDGTLTGSIREFTVLSARIIGTGSLDMIWQVDTPTSESNLAASGSAPLCIPGSMSELGVFQCDNNRIKMHATPATTMAVAGSGKPNLYTAAGTALFKRYKLWAWNRSSSAVTVEVTVAD